MNKKAGVGRLIKNIIFILPAITPISGNQQDKQCSEHSQLLLQISTQFKLSA